MPRRKQPKNQTDFFAEIFDKKFEGFKGGNKPTEPLKPSPPEMSRWEKFYTEKWIDALVWSITAPIKVGPSSAECVRRQGYGGDVVLERLINLMKISKRHTEVFEEQGESDDLYRELGHDWKDPANRLTNWETCFLLMDVSFAQPLPRHAFEEYKRAFAHCFPLEVYMQCFCPPNSRFWEMEARINLNECEMCRMSVGYNKLQALDETEKQWIEDFNQRLSEPTTVELVEQLFKKKVEVKR